MAQRSTSEPRLDHSDLIEGRRLNKASSATTAEVWVPARPANIKRNNWSTTGKLLLGGLSLLIFTSLLLFIILVSILLFNSELIFPGIQVMGVDVGSMTKGEAAAVLTHEWEKQTVLMSHEEGVWPVGVADLGLTLDANATVEEAHKQGRSMAGLRRLVADGGNIEPVWTFDSIRAEKFLADFSEQVARRPVNAGLQIKDGQVVETLPVEGRVLDSDETLNRLQENPAQVLIDGRLPLNIRAVEPEISDVSAMAQEARRLLSTTVTVHAYDPIRDESQQWTVSPSQWGDWITLDLPVGEDGEIQWIVDEAAAMSATSTWLPPVGDDRYLDGEKLIADLVNAVSVGELSVEARIFHRPRKHTVQSGETLASIGRAYGIPYPWIQQANPNSDFLQPGDELVIPSADEMLPLPVVNNKRVVVSISEQRTWVFEDGSLKWDWPASTGIDSSPTSPGIFQIQNHEPNAYASNWDLWMPNFMGIYRPVPTSDFMNGFHGFPTRNGSSLLWTGDLGHQVTYGCILLSSENAAQLYDWAEDGVVVEVRP